MTPSNSHYDRPIGVGAVGVLPGIQDGLLAELPQDAGFRFVAFSDEGLPEGLVTARPVTYCPDYNVLLQDPEVELVLVDGPLDLRRDMAVRALNAGRHVVIPLPFSETALGAERIMKTALAGRGLVATADCRWRDDPDLLALRAALAAEDVGPVQGLFFFGVVPPRPPAEEPLLVEFLPEDEAEPEEVDVGMLGECGVEFLDQVHLIAGDYVKNVNAHRIAPAAPGAPSGSADGFMVYLALRRGGWAVAQVTTHRPAGLPRWAVYTPHATVTARGGSAVVITATTETTYTAPSQVQGFCDNLYAAVRNGAELKSSPVDIVRAMKLHEAAIESLLLGEPVTI